MGSCKTEPESNPNPVVIRNRPQPKNPLEALSYQTRNSPRKFPAGVSYCPTSQGISASLSFNGVLYQACEKNHKYALQKLAVYILYGEFDQDAVELYNYYLRKENKDIKDQESIPGSMFLDSKTVDYHIQNLKKGTPIEANKMPERVKDKDTATNSATRNADNSGKALPHNTQLNVMVPRKVMPLESERSRKRKSEAKERKKLIESERRYLGEEEEIIASSGRDDFPEISEREIILELERKLSKQMLITFEPVTVPAEDEIDNEIQNLQEFINNSDHDIEVESCTFECVPNCCCPFYNIVSLEYLGKAVPAQINEHIFVGKGSDKTEAFCYALQVTVEFIKRSKALDYKLIPPNDDVIETLGQVLGLDISEIPFKQKFNKQFSLYQVSLVNKDETFVSEHYAEEIDAKEDVAKKVLRSMNYCFCGDTRNRKLTVESNA